VLKVHLHYRAELDRKVFFGFGRVDFEEDRAIAVHNQGIFREIRHLAMLDVSSGMQG